MDIIIFNFTTYRKNQETESVYSYISFMRLLLYVAMANDRIG